MQDGQDETIDINIDMVLSDLSDSSRQQHLGSALASNAVGTNYTSTIISGMDKGASDVDKDIVIIGPESRFDSENGHVFGMEMKL
jgi:hypothetical protein